MTFWSLGPQSRTIFKKALLVGPQMAPEIGRGLRQGLLQTALPDAQPRHGQECSSLLSPRCALDTGHSGGIYTRKLAHAPLGAPAPPPGPQPAVLRRTARWQDPMPKPQRKRV